MRYMLDTNTLVYVLNARPQHQAVLERFNQHDPSTLCLSSITLAELHFGIEKSQVSGATQRKLARALATLDVAAFEHKAASAYGVVRANLESAGTPIGPLDTLIAAHALSLAVTLVTTNTREFDRVPGLRVENWMPA